MAVVDAERSLETRRKEVRGGMVAVAAVAVCAFVAHLVEIESVMATGPLLLIAGLVAVIAGARAGLAEAKLMGALAMTLPVTLLVAVQVYDWSPARAGRPFAIVGTLALAAIVALAARGWRRTAPLPTVVVSTAAMMPVPVAKAPSDTPAR